MSIVLGFSHRQKTIFSTNFILTVAMCFIENVDYKLGTQSSSSLLLRFRVRRVRAKSQVARAQVQLSLYHPYSHQTWSYFDEERETIQSLIEVVRAQSDLAQTIVFATLKSSNSLSLRSRRKMALTTSLTPLLSARG